MGPGGEDERTDGLGRHGTKEGCKGWITMGLVDLTASRLHKDTDGRLVSRHRRIVAG